MNVVVAVMDRAGFDANTDVIVLVEPEQRRLRWVPRDLWCPALGDRVNVAYRRGGSSTLLEALGEHGLEAGGSICLSRTATERALAGVRVIVPVPQRMVFDYPMTPTTPIEEGRRTVVFEPPLEVLSGERVHQWIGARGGSDLHRIARQCVLIWRLLDQGFDFALALADPAAVRFDPEEDTVISVLRTVDASWSTDVLRGVRPEVIDGKDVLVRLQN